MKLEAIERFNNHDPGDVFEASDENARVWIEEGLAQEASEEAAVENYTVAQLKEKLQNAGVEIPAGAKKAALVELYKRALAEDKE